MIKDVKLSLSDFMVKHQVKFRFLVVGIWNTVFGYLVFIGFDSLFTPVFQQRYVSYMSASVLSNSIAVINAYIFHKFFTFQSKIKGIGIVFEFLRFTSTYIVTFFLSLFFLPLFVEILKLSPKIAGALVIVCCTVISYVGHLKFSFKN